MYIWLFYLPVFEEIAKGAQAEYLRVTPGKGLAEYLLQTQCVCREQRQANKYKG